MSSFSSLTVRPSGCERIKLRTVSWHGPAQEIYDYTTQFHLTDFHCSTWKGGPLGVGAYILGKNHRFKTDSRSDNSESNPERQTQITNVSITIPRKQHSTRILLDDGKNFGAPDPAARRGRRRPDRKMHAHFQLRFSDLVSGHYKIIRYAGAALYPRFIKTRTPHLGQSDESD